MDDRRGMLEFLSDCKKEICRVLSADIANRVEFGGVHALGSDLTERLISFTEKGKMLRGGLVCLAAGILDGDIPSDAYRAGAAMELFQSGLLIHDDIMDRDLLRRGAPSIFGQYREAAEASGTGDEYHLAEALGICAGDVALFLGFELLGSIGAGPAVGLYTQAATELAYVSIAQMADVLRGTAGERLIQDSPMEKLLRTDNPENAVLELYRFKTGRYTFSLPLVIGATFGGAGEILLELLSLLGEDLGILFQLKDDEIDLFGDEEETGKPVGTDIREGKKTLFHLYLFSAAGIEERKDLLGIFGNRDADDAQINFVLDAMAAYGVRDKVRQMAGAYAEKAGVTLDKLDGIDKGRQRLLQELIAYNMNRTR